MSETFTFTGKAGQMLAATLERPTGTPRATAIFAHCFTCSKESLAARSVSNALAEAGIATLRFDFTGIGKSGGNFADSHFSANLEDLLAASDALTERVAPAALLIGHSLGGAAVIAAASEISSVTAVATIGAPFEVDHVLNLIGDDHSEKAKAGECVTVTIGGQKLDIDKDFIANMHGHDQAERLSKLRRALLVMHAARDEIVGIENASDIFQAAKHPKSFVSLESANHLLTKASDAHYAANVIAAWAERYLPPMAEAPDGPAEGTVRVTGTEAKFRQIIEASGHTLIADEPKSYGGDNLGPTPYDLLLAGLGTCTSMTIRMVADRENIPLDHVSVTLKHNRCHSEDCASEPVDAGTKKGKLDVIERVLTLKGDFDDKQRARMIAVADRCPVHKTLENSPHIVTRLAED